MILVPLDDRPCCRQFPERLAAMAGHRLVLPPRELLGRYLDPGHPDEILDWLDDHPGPAILSLDMLCWGGLVASRRMDLPLDRALERLERVRGRADAYAFSIIMRTAPTQTSFAEVERAQRVTELSLWMARERRGEPGAEEQVRALRAEIPAEWVDAYLGARNRNHEVNRRALEAGFRFLVLGVDDSRTEGLNVLEARHLEESGALVAPGTDETAMLLLVRALAPGTALKVYWSRREDAARIGRYEDRNMGGVVRAQARAAGVELQERADRQLWVYGPYGEQIEASQQGGGSARSRRAEDFVRKLARELDRGTRIAVADVARANGADLGLARALLESGVAARLAGYAAWNTAGNTIGTALAAAALAPDDPTPEGERERLAFLVERFADDYLYEADVRQHLQVPAFVPLEGELLEAVRSEVREKLEEGIAGIAAHLGVQPKSVRVDLPWPRAFEVEVEVEVEVQV